MKMNEKNDSFVRLGSFDQIRASQLIMLYGPGALVPLSHRVVMTGAPEMWADGCQTISDPRLAKALHVDGFRIPVPADVAESEHAGASRQVGVDYVSFPDWYFCPKCHHFRRLSDWLEETVKRTKDDPAEAARKFMKKPTCPDPACKHTPLVVARLVTVCEHGHIDDFPWVEWVHLKKQGDTICDHPDLRITLKGSNQGFSGFKITCETCGEEADLQNALGIDTFMERDRKLGRRIFGCKGRHPWRGSHQENETCTLYPRALLRGASSLYYSVIRTSIVIPEPRAKEKNAIRDNGTFVNKLETFRDDMDFTGEELVKALMKSKEKISAQTGLSVSTVEKWLPDVVCEIEHPEKEERYDPVLYREQEYEKLLSDTPKEKDFYRETCPDPDGILKKELPFLSAVVLVHKLREVRAQIGFSRLKPANSPEDEGFVPITEAGTRWLPAYDVRGEGIFLQFDEAQIHAWEAAHPEVAARAALLSEHYAHTYFAEYQPRRITAKFLFLHSMAHLLIRALSFECGYSIASLRERIYCDRADGRPVMSGILIYTANGDAEGTLGGLVRQGYPDALPRIFHQAIEEARFCANDPVCSLSKGQGRDALNLAACHACMLLPETSCEEFNSFLDRGVIVGTMEESGIGFFSDASAFAARKTGKEPDRREPAQETLRSAEAAKPQAKHRYAALTEQYPAQHVTSARVLQNLRELAQGEPQAEAFVQKLADAGLHALPDAEITGSYRAEGSEGTSFDVTCLFPSCHMMLFFENESDSFPAAEKTGWHCFSTERGFAFEDLVALLRQEE